MSQLTNKQWIEAFYVAYFGRPGDPAGVAYWLNQVETGALDLAGVASNFALQAEAQAAYGFFYAYSLGYPISDAMYDQFVTAIYQNLFERAPDAAGKAYWIDQLKTGAADPGSFIADVIYSAFAGQEGASADDWATLYNKALAAEYFTDYLVENSITWTEALSDEVEAIINNVTKDSTLADVYQQIETAVTTEEQTGQTFTLTKSTVTGTFDNFTGTSGDDTFQAGPGAAETGDVLNGGAGTDTLKIQQAGGTAVTIAPTLNSVEKVMLNEPTSGNDGIDTTLSLVNATGVTEVWADRVTDADGGADDGVEFTGFGKAVQLGIVSGDTSAAGANRADVTFTLNDVTGTSDSATLVLDGASVDDVTIAGVETLNIKGQTASSRIDGTLNAAAATKLVFTGDKDIRIDATDINETNSYTVDASAFTGNLTITLEDQAAGKSTTVTGGSGNDKIYLGTGLDANDSIDGGAGTNTIGFTDAADLTAATGAKLKNFQIFDAAGAAVGTYDMDLITGGGTSSTITGVAVSADLGGAVTIDNLVDTGAVAINATMTSALTIQQKGAGAAGSNADTLTFNLSSATGNITVASLVAADIETVTINSKATTGVTTGHTITATTFADATTVKFTGDEQLTVTTLGAVAATNIDASGMTDKFIMTNASSAATVLLLQGGSAGDTLKVSATQLAGTVVQGNGGADTIDLGAGAVAMTVKLAARTDSTATAFDKVSNWNDGEDLIDVSAFAFSAAAQAVINNTSKVTITGAGANATFTISEADAVGFFNNGANRAISYADNGTDTFVFIDANKDGNWSAADDCVILLVANTGSTFTTADFIFA